MTLHDGSTGNGWHGVLEVDWQGIRPELGADEDLETILDTLRDEFAVCASRHMDEDDPE